MKKLLFVLLLLPTAVDASEVGLERKMTKAEREAEILRLRDQITQLEEQIKKSAAQWKEVNKCAKTLAPLVDAATNASNEKATQKLYKEHDTLRLGIDPSIQTIKKTIELLEKG